jgi:multiple sugar transport system ATP-binding protein
VLELDGSATVTMGSQRVELDDSVLASRPSLRGYGGCKLVLGIRPEDMEDATLVSDAPPGRRIRATPAIVEELGAELLLHFDVDAPPVLTEDTIELARESGAIGDLDTDAPLAASELIARVSPRSAATPGQATELALDTARAHFFDLDTGLAIR